MRKLFAALGCIAALGLAMSVAPALAADDVTFADDMTAVAFDDVAVFDLSAAAEEAFALVAPAMLVSELEAFVLVGDDEGTDEFGAPDVGSGLPLFTSIGDPSLGVRMERLSG